MTRISIGLVLALVCGLSASPAVAAFDNLSVSPRARAMGDAGVAVADDAFTSYLNPAGLAGMAEPALGTSYLRPYGLSFTDLIYLGGALPLGGRSGVLGFGIRRFGVNSQDVDLLTESTYTLSHGLTLYEDLHTVIRFGSAVNVYNLEFGPSVSDLDPGSDTVVGFDLGCLVTLRERTRLGLFVKNANNPQIGRDQEEIPQRIHGGIAYEPYLGVVTTFEFENVLGEEVQYHGGVEMEVATGLNLRFGTMTQPNKLTAGFGYQISGLAVHYGFSTGGGTLDESHQFGLTYSWGGEAP